MKKSEKKAAKPLSEIVAQRSLLEKELVKFRLSLDQTQISVTGGYAGLVRELKVLKRAEAVASSKGSNQ
jgi:hypothetical protein